MIQVKGHNGRVEFDGQFVKIIRKGFLARASVGKGEKRIPVTAISSVQWKPAGALVNGYIEFGVPGGVERRAQFGRQTTDAVKDENSVLFTKSQMPAFERLRTAVEQALRSVPQPASGGTSLADELTKLAVLVREGVLSEAEYEQQKARLLTR